MESLIAASESFYDNSKVEDVNFELFNSFMKKITVWDYSCITREYYLSLPIHEKKAIAKKYYFDMRSRTCGKMYSFFYWGWTAALICLLLTNLRGEILWINF